MPPDPEPDPLAPFSPAVRRWFEASFAGPTPAQAAGWRAISNGGDTLLSAPTGSGKTLASFLWGIDRLTRTEPGADRPEGVKLVYVSPLKALSYDIDRNLKAPLAGIGGGITVGIRTGDTPQNERNRMRREPPDILITTPESLYLMLSSGAREILRTVETVIVDEIHAVAATKRGAHLALTLERLEHLATGGNSDRRIQRIGLSATQRPLERVAGFLSGPGRSCQVIDPGQAKELDLEIVVPVEDMANPAADSDQGSVDPDDPPIRSIWPAIYPELLAEVRTHRSTIIFVNNRRGAERLAQRLNELDRETPTGPDDESVERTPELPLARAHHGSLSHEERSEVEEQLKAGEIPCLVATSSLELGIDMGAVDLVIQVESPKSVARGLQRVGRAGHGLGETSKGRIFPKFRGDLLESAVIARRMRAGEIEETVIPANPLDVLAQHLVSMAALDPWDTDEALELVRRTAPFAELSREQFENVLDMLDGRYPSDRFAELRPRLVWDRTACTITGRKGAQSLVVTNAGTIPDRGLYGVHLPDGRRVGELDEEMVYETRAGQVFLLGASSWRIQEITRDRVIVVPAPGVPGAVPFWKGDGIGRPAELGQAIGAFAREAVNAEPEELEVSHDLDPLAARNLVAYLREQQQATRVVPSDRTVVIERFRDEIGDWRLCVLTPWGGRVHAAWALAISERFKRELDLEVDAIHSDDGIALHLPDADDPPDAQLALIEPDELEELVVAALGGSALFGARFRENAARSLLLPRAYPGKRTPLWQQRLKAQSLLEVARDFPRFPVTLETYRECLGDIFDLPALKQLLADISSRRISLVEVETATASPFASGLIFDYVATYMYEGDTPSAERRATALSLDRELLRELLGQEELRELIDPDALRAVEDSLQCLSEAGRAKDADGLQQILRRIGDLTAAEVAERLVDGVSTETLLDQLVRERRAARVRIAGEDRYIAAEDAGLYRDSLGVVPPAGLPTAFTEERPEPLRTLVSRFARTNGPFTTGRLRQRYGVDPAPVLRELERQGSIVRGEILPGGTEREWCEAEVLRRIRRASLARFREEIEAADGHAYARFLASWHGVDRKPVRGGVDRLREVLVPLQGVGLTRAVWEQDVLPRRIGSYSPVWLDQLTTSGEVVWVGAGSVGRTDGKVALYFREDAALVGPPPANAKLEPPTGEVHDAIRAALAQAPSFWSDLAGQLDFSTEELHEALWDLAFAGEITNDSFAPLRAPRLRAVNAGEHRRRRFSRRPSVGPAVQGRWSLTASLFPEPVDHAARSRARAELLLERHGIVAREMVLSEGIPGGFAAVYPDLAALEMLGSTQRGYFVEGLGGRQFALSGAVERLRSLAGTDQPGFGEILVLAATDPASPWGAVLPWPRAEGRRSPSRVAGAWVVTRAGRPLLYVERGGRSLLTLVAEPESEELDAAFAALLAEAEAGRIEPLKVERIDGQPVLGTTFEARLTASGFSRQPRRLTAPA